MCICVCGCGTLLACVRVLARERVFCVYLCVRACVHVLYTALIKAKVLYDKS